MLGYKGNLVRVFDDPYRTVYQTTEEGRVVQVVYIKHSGGNPLGAHYHQQTHEYYRIVCGGGQLYHCTVNQEGKPCGEVERRWLREGSSVVIPPYTAHHFGLLEQTLLVYVPEPSLPKEDTKAALWLLGHAYRPHTDNEGQDDEE